MRTIFLDTMGLVAIWNTRDQWHAAGNAVYRMFDPKATRLVTTSFVLLECADSAARRSYRADVVRLREDLEMLGDLFEPTVAEVNQAWLAFARGGLRAPGVVDLVSFAVMRRLGITQAFTHDGHFTAAGFEVLF